MISGLSTALSKGLCPLSNDTCVPAFFDSTFCIRENNFHCAYSCIRELLAVNAELNEEIQALDELVDTLKIEVFHLKSLM